jgi:hypothetical protein
MLSKMKKSNFHKNATIRNTKKLNTLLLETPINTKAKELYVEIIPYEILWGLVLGILDNRAR